jgi:ribosomal protein L37AE/L43A
MTTLKIASGTNPDPPCPRCGRIASVARQGGLFYCRACAALFDDDPNEGGDYSDRDPSARIERQERQRGRRRAY